MDMKSPNITLEDGLDLRKVQTTGSLLHINEVYDDTDCDTEKGNSDQTAIDFLGEPIKDFKELEKKLTRVDSNGYVRKKIFEEGGGLPLGDGVTVFIAFSGYWENQQIPFDVITSNKPMEVNLQDNGLLPGILMAVRTMLVGELSIFLLSYKVMYGEMGIPPRIKPKADCVFYIKLIKCVNTPKEGKINLSEPNMFHRVNKEVKMLLSSGLVLYKNTNYSSAAQLFRKAVNMLHKCRLADENEERIQEKLLVKFYTNLAICYTKMKQPLRTCIACNELQRLNCLWNNGKALFQNAKALRMIGEFNLAEKRLRRAMKLSQACEEMNVELKLILNTRDICNQAKLVTENIVESSNPLVTEQFKNEVDNLIKHFKENVNLCKLTLPATLNSCEIQYLKEACVKESLFFNRIPKNLVTVDEDTVYDDVNLNNKDITKHNYVLDKEKKGNNFVRGNNFSFENEFEGLVETDQEFTF